MSDTPNEKTILSERAQWTAYLGLLLVLGFAQLWEARLFTWYTDDYDFIDQARKLNESFWFLFSPELVTSGRPTTSLFFWFFHTVWGDDQVPYHIGLIFFHILTVWIVAWTLREIGYSVVLAMLTGVFFSSMYVDMRYRIGSHVSPIWAVCRSDVWPSSRTHDTRFGKTRDSSYSQPSWFWCQQVSTPGQLDLPVWPYTSHTGEAQTPGK